MNAFTPESTRLLEERHDLRAHIKRFCSDLEDCDVVLKMLAEAVKSCERNCSEAEVTRVFDGMSEALLDWEPGYQRISNHDMSRDQELDDNHRGAVPRNGRG